MTNYKENALGFSKIDPTDINIESNGGGTSVVGRNSINLFRLISLKQALALQLKGIRLTRNGSGTALGKRIYGLRGNAQTMLDAVTAEIDHIKAERETHHG